jgi:hypothetical protein
VYFSNDALDKLQTGHSEVAGNYRRLLISYGEREYKNLRAKEYATHGFLRRLQTLVRCIDNVFELLPPDLAEPPTHRNPLDATINVQAFVFNVFVCIDNLVWIWVQEKPVEKEGGTPIPSGWVGLRKNNTFVRGSNSTWNTSSLIAVGGGAGSTTTLSDGFQEFLNKLDDWYDYLESFRHTLAHRIPLYIPPYTIPTDKEADHYELLAGKFDALKRRDREEYQRFEARRKALAAFTPIMTHSFEDKAKVINFHGQLLIDFFTIEELADKMLGELNRE